jgi:hypothetical protein
MVVSPSLYSAAILLLPEFGISLNTGENNNVQRWNHLNSK